MPAPAESNKTGEFINLGPRLERPAARAARGANIVGFVFGGKTCILVCKIEQIKKAKTTILLWPEEATAGTRIPKPEFEFINNNREERRSATILAFPSRTNKPPASAPKLAKLFL